MCDIGCFSSGVEGRNESTVRVVKLTTTTALSAGNRKGTEYYLGKVDWTVNKKIRKANY